MKNFMDYDFNIDRITFACYVAKGAGTPVHNNRKTHGLAFYEAGNNCFSFEQNNIEIKQNSIIYLPKGSDYIVKGTPDKGCYAINFLIDEKVDFKPFLFTTKNKAGFLERFRKADAIWKSQTPGYQMKCKAELYSIICDMQDEFRLGYISKSTLEIIMPAIDYIHTNYTFDNISITFLAQICGISETYFRQIFRKSYGISPLKYINNLKITRAKELIQSGMYSISDIAFLSGFHDESYFSREFKKATGVSPKNY